MLQKTKIFLNRKGLLIFFFLLLTNPIFSDDYNYLTFNTEDGLAQSYVYSINQDEQGYLWIGTGEGLSRYNGFIFENFTTKDSLSDNFITCAINDGKYHWFGHMDGNLTYFDGKKFYPVRLLQSDQSPVTHFSKSPDGQIWASKYADGLIKLSNEKSVLKHYRFKEQTIIVSFEFLGNDFIIIGTNTGLLYCRLKESGEIEIIRKVSEIPESKIMCIQKMRNQKGFYIVTENEGLFQFYNQDNQIKVSPIKADSILTGIQFIYEDTQSNLWLATFGKGLIRMNYSAKNKIAKIDYFNKANGFATDNVKYIFEDREGNIWSGNYGDGLTLITPKTFSINTFDKTLYGNEIYSIYINGQFRWIGTENGLLKVEQSTGRILKFYDNGLPKDNVTAIYSKDDKELWIGTENNGVFCMSVNDEIIVKFPLGGGDLENSVTCITGKGEQVWIGTKKGLCNINLVSNTKNWYSISKGLPHNFINCLYIDRKGKLWVSTQSNAICYIQEEKVNKILLNSVSRNITIGPITEDADSAIWIGSNGQGVFKIKSDSVINLTAKNGLLSDYCYSIICDNYKNIWVGHKGGLSKIRTADLSVKPIQQFEAKNENYLFNPNSVFKDQLDKIWFGSSKGLVYYDPSMEHTQLKAPALSITSVKINDNEKEYIDKMILSPGTYKIQFNFIGINLKEPELVTYQYKLDGDEQWSDIIKNRSITYNHLIDGEYTFLLRAYSGDGVVTENPLIITIIINKPIWKKWWFYLVLFLSLIVLIYIYIKRRERKLLSEKQILEEKVKERTQEIQLQKNEIEKQRDIINKKNASITSSIKYAGNIQNAIFPPKELIDKLLPDNFILNMPKEIVSGDFFWLSEKNNKIIFAVADCTGHGVPGAFMSVLGITLLNEIINQGITKSDIIVSKLRESVVKSLQQGRKDLTTLDGMDISLCVLDRQEKKIQFTGGMNDVAYISRDELQVLKADRLSVSTISDSSKPYTMQEFSYNKGDVLYLFSDGYKDQFGGVYQRKYLIRRLYNLFLKIHKLQMKEQKEYLIREINDWMEGYSQTDDITILGIRL